MKSKLVQINPVFFSSCAIVFAYFSLWCTSIGNVCYDSWLDHIFIDFVNPLYFFSLYFLPAAVALIFVRRDIFNSWLNLAKYALPLAFIFIAGTHVTSGAYMDFYPFYRDDAARVAGGALTALTLLLIGWKYVKQRN